VRFRPSLPCALVLGERVIESDFFIREARLLAARPRRPDVPREGRAERRQGGIHADSYRPGQSAQPTLAQLRQGDMT
jgi:hypothetical protein